MEKIDLKDRKILYELDVNCRQSNSSLAKKTRVSKDIINYRIKKLEEKGIIEGYRAIIDLSKLGYNIYRVYIKLQDTYGEIEDKLIDHLINRKEIWWVGKVSGKYDIVFAFWAKSQRIFYEFWVDFLEKYRRYIHHELISTFIEYIHFRRTYLLNLNKDTTEVEIIGGGEEVDYDSTDLKILKILASNARVQLLDLAEKINLTPMAVKYRIKNLEKKGVIQGYRALIDFSKLGLEYYKVDMYLEDTKIIKEIQSFCKEQPNIVYIDRTIGASDMEFDFEIENLSKFMEIMDLIKQKFKGTIRNFEYFSVLKIYKTVYFPD